VLWLWTFVLAFGTVSTVFLEPRYSIGLLVAGFLIASGTTFSPAFRRMVWRMWQGVGAAAVPPRRVDALGRPQTRANAGETNDDTSYGDKGPEESDKENGIG